MPAARIAASQLATQASTTLSTLTPSASRRPVYMTMVCSTVPSTSTATPPISTATPSSTHRIAMPTSASTTIRPTSAIGPPLARTPGSSQNVTASTTKLVRPLRTSDLAQATVGRHSRASRSVSRRLRRTVANGRSVTLQDSHRSLVARVQSISAEYTIWRSCGRNGHRLDGTSCVNSITVSCSTGSTQNAVLASPPQ